MMQGILRRSSDGFYSEMKYNLIQLQSEFRKGKKLKYLFFWKPEKIGSGELAPGCLSQWWSAKFIIKGITFSSTEQFMMAEKARLFNDLEIYNQILKCKSPVQFKQLGRKIKGFDEEVWKENRINIVYTGNLAKFKQNPELMGYLISTKKKIVVEASSHDSIWGIGLDENNEHIKNPLKWKGLNLLGFILMQVRDDLKL